MAGCRPQPISTVRALRDQEPVADRLAAQLFLGGEMKHIAPFVTLARHRAVDEGLDLGFVRQPHGDVALIRILHHEPAKRVCIA